nr:FAD-dependent oxidoreductase [Tessaracoccus coleopterorum]
MIDFCVIGGGIVGLATAMTLLQRNPGASLVVCEKDDRIAPHQTSHNSGVIHAGVYYPPGSLKARLCRLGAAWTRQFCRERGIPFAQPGKLIVATDDTELVRLAALGSGPAPTGCGPSASTLTNCAGVNPTCVGWARSWSLRRASSTTGPSRGPWPNGSRTWAEGCASVPGSRASGGRDRCDRGARRRRHPRRPTRRLRRHPGRPGRADGRAGRRVRDAPVQGEYYRLPPSRAGLIDHLIYPVPDPSLPFLGST